MFVDGSVQKVYPSLDKSYFSVYGHLPCERYTKFNSKTLLDLLPLRMLDAVSSFPVGGEHQRPAKNDEAPCSVGPYFIVSLRSPQ